MASLIVGVFVRLILMASILCAFLSNCTSLRGTDSDPQAAASMPWLAEYWNTPDGARSGQPASVVGQVPSDVLDLNWGQGSPAPGIPVNNFSARFSKNFILNPGCYQISYGADDKYEVRLRSANRDLLFRSNFKSEVGAQPNITEILQIPSYETYQLEIGMQEQFIDARVFLALTPSGDQSCINLPPQASCQGPAWQIETFNNRFFQGPANLSTRCSTELDEHFPVNSSVRFTRDLQPGLYEFRVKADDFAFLYKDSVQISSHQDPSAMPTFGPLTNELRGSVATSSNSGLFQDWQTYVTITGCIQPMNGNPARVVGVFFDQGGDAFLRLRYQRMGDCLP